MLNGRGATPTYGIECEVELAWWMGGGGKKNTVGPGRSGPVLPIPP
jgi:hypothetical protein